MGDTASTLNEAYQLIENGQPADARNLLKPLLESDSGNPDVWWLYIHAAEDAEDGRRALDKLVELSPNYPGLPDLYQQVTGTPLCVGQTPQCLDAVIPRFAGADGQSDGERDP